MNNKLVFITFLIFVIFGLWSLLEVNSVDNPTLSFHEDLSIGARFNWNITTSDIVQSIIHEGNILTIEINETLTDNYELDQYDQYDVFTDYYGDVFTYYVNGRELSSQEILSLYRTIRLEMNFFLPIEYSTISQTYDYMALRCNYINSEEGSFQFFNDTSDELYFETTTYRSANLNENYLTINMTSIGLREWTDDLDRITNESWIVKINETISTTTGLLCEYNSYFTQTNYDINSIGGEYVISSFEENLTFKFLNKEITETSNALAILSPFSIIILIFAQTRIKKRKNRNLVD